jgi:hypothetical protein
MRDKSRLLPKKCRPFGTTFVGDGTKFRSFEKKFRYMRNKLGLMTNNMRISKSWFRKRKMVN